MVSKRERLALAVRISGVMNGLCVEDEQVIEREGACLSMRVVRTELNSEKY